MLAQGQQQSVPLNQQMLCPLPQPHPSPYPVAPLIHQSQNWILSQEQQMPQKMKTLQSQRLLDPSKECHLKQPEIDRRQRSLFQVQSLTERSLSLFIASDPSA